MKWKDRLLGWAKKDADLETIGIKQAYHRLFVGANGQFTPDAELFFADIMEKAQLHTGVLLNKAGGVSVEHTFIREGKQEIVYFILHRIFNRPNISLNQTKEPKNYDEFRSIVEAEIENL